MVCAAPHGAHAARVATGHASALAEMNEVMTEMEDYLSYVGDILEVATARLRVEVARKFWDGYVEPAILAPLLQLQVRSLPRDAGALLVRCGDA